MIPLLTIVIAAVVGFITYGIVGLIVGAVSGWVLSMLIGTVLCKWSGGLLPRKARRDCALYFYMNHQPMIDSCMEDMPESEKIRLIEKLIERIFRRATVDAPMLSKSMGMSRSEVSKAAEAEAEIEQDERTREMILLLRDHILATMY